MISIIVSSHKENLFSQFSENVKHTIGNIPYEIIQINNPGLMSICQAYNEGASRAKYPYLVFSHEDILFHTTNWGHIIINIFEQDNSIGLIGCAGGNYKSYLPVGWAINPKYCSKYMIGTHYGTSYFSQIYNGISNDIELNKNRLVLADLVKPKIINEEVLMLDGMFLSTRKNIHEKFSFDQNAFTGFHCYDLDYSFQIKKNYKVVVNHNILIEHFSAGNFDLRWLDEMRKFNKKWQKNLPLSLQRYTIFQKVELEYNCLEVVLRICKYNQLSFISIFKIFFHVNYIYRINILVWLTVLFKIVKKILTLSIKFFYLRVENFFRNFMYYMIKI